MINLLCSDAYRGACDVRFALVSNVRDDAELIALKTNHACVRFFLSTVEV